MTKANISCGNCFYSYNGTDIQPCLTCHMYDKWVPHDIYKEDEEVKPVHDVVQRPKHYMLFEDKNIEVRDVIEKLVSKLDNYSGMFIADYVQMMQYSMRFMDKNGLEDLEKCRWYLDKLIESLKK